MSYTEQEHEGHGGAAGSFRAEGCLLCPSDDCGSCGAVTDAALAVVGEPYHGPDEDCRAVRAYKE